MTARRASDTRSLVGTSTANGASAILSPDGRYRYRLERIVRPAGALLECPDTVAFIMLNPSTADATEDDPTIRRCRGFAAALGARRLVVGNLFAWRATDPGHLYLESMGGHDVAGPDNDEHLRRIVAQAGIVIAGWGACGKFYKQAAARAGVVGDMARAAGKELQALGVTGGGMPRHPLYVAAVSRPTPWRMP